MYIVTQNIYKLQLKITDPFIRWPVLSTSSLMPSSYIMIWENINYLYIGKNIHTRCYFSVYKCICAIYNELFFSPRLSIQRYTIFFSYGKIYTICVAGISALWTSSLLLGLFHSYWIVDDIEVEGIKQKKRSFHEFVYNSLNFIHTRVLRRNSTIRKNNIRSLRMEGGKEGWLGSTSGH